MNQYVSTVCAEPIHFVIARSSGRSIVLQHWCTPLITSGRNLNKEKYLIMLYSRLWFSWDLSIRTQKKCGSSSMTGQRWRVRLRLPLLVRLSASTDARLSIFFFLCSVSYHNFSSFSYFLMRVSHTWLLSAWFCWRPRFGFCQLKKWHTQERESADSLLIIHDSQAQNEINKYLFLLSPPPSWLGGSQQAKTEWDSSLLIARGGEAWRRSATLQVYILFICLAE